ncbi:hypothetical protein NST69_15505 [Paenibacillus sp. FSL P2-0089]|uniref:hypothetical protein n=1 Tax=Paenibacillus sp. FSL P2-0089 TaxID=2954526 RepID=UPI00315A57B7
MAKIVIAVLEDDGTFRPNAVQDINEWNNGEKNINVMLEKSGYTLFDILFNDLGKIILNEGKFKFTHIFTKSTEETAMRLMGNIAEAIIVRRCSESIELNERYITIARKGKKLLKTTENYIAVATGHKKTKSLHPTKYNPNHTQNDIIWLDKNNPDFQLLEEGAKVTSGKSAALQVKASNFNSDYVFKELKNEKYKVPIVYFGMRDNFYKIKNKIILYQNVNNVNNKFIDIRDIDSEAYIQYLEYKQIIKKLIDKEIEVSDLISTKDTLLSTGLLLTEKSNKSPIIFT